MLFRAGAESGTYMPHLGLISLNMGLFLNSLLHGDLKIAAPSTPKFCTVLIFLLWWSWMSSSMDDFDPIFEITEVEVRNLKI